VPPLPGVDVETSPSLKLDERVYGERPVAQFTLGEQGFAVIPVRKMGKPMVNVQGPLKPLLHAAKYLVDHPKSDKGRRELEAAVELVETSGA